MPKKIIISICIFVFSIIILFIFMGLNTPNVQQIGKVLVVITLIYSATASLIYTGVSVFTKIRPRLALRLSLILGCLLPILIILNSLQQASIFDLMLLALTIGLIIWYAINKR